MIQPIEPIPAFACIYLDTEPLRRAGWPRESAELDELFRIAQELSVAVVIPEPVEMELQRQWCATIQKQWSEAEECIAGTIRKLAKISESTGQSFTTPRPIGDADTVLISSRYAEVAGSIKEKWRIQSAPVTRRQVAELFDMAIKRDAPFERVTMKPPERKESEGTAGFQDAVILLSAIDHLKTVTGRAGVLVSADHIFQDPSIYNLAERAGTAISIVGTVGEVISLLKQRLPGERARVWGADTRNADLALRSRSVQLEQYILKYFSDLWRDDPGPKIHAELKAERVRDLEISDVSTPDPAVRVPGSVRISFSARAKMDAKVTDLEPSKEPWTSEETGTVRMPLSSAVSYPTKLTVQLDIEAVARWTDGAFESVTPDRVVSSATYIPPRNRQPAP